MIVLLLICAAIVMVTVIYDYSHPRPPEGMC